MPSVACRSSSFAITRSMSRTSGRITCCASASVQSLRRKFRSMLTRAPAARAAATASRVAAAAFAPSAGVMPVTWNQAVAAKSRRPIHAGGIHLADRRPGAIVDDHRRPLARAALGVVDADAIAAAEDGFGANAFGAKRFDRRVADRVRRQPRHIPALDPELRQADGDVGFAAAERGDELRASGGSARNPAGSAAA